MTRFLPILLIISICIAAAILISTPEGLGVFPDSVQYIRTASLIKSGQFGGESNPAEALAALSRFPPLFPVLLTPFMDGEAGLHQTLRVPFALLAALNAVLLGSLLFTAASKHRLLAVSLTMLGVSSIAFIRQHLMLYSEPLFLALELGLLLLIIPSGSWQERNGAPFLSALLTMLASLTRYAGISFGGIGSLCAIIREDLPIRRKIYSVVLFCAALLPVASWILFLRSTEDSLGGRTIHNSTLTLEGLTHLTAEIGALLAPISFLPSEIAQALAAIVVLSALAAAAARTPLGRSALAGMVVYLGFLLFVHSTVDAAVPFNDRILLPLLPFILVLTAVALTGEKISERIRTLFCIAIISLSVLQAAVLAAPVCAASVKGVGFSNGKVSHSELFSFLRQLDSSRPLTSNYPEVMLLHANKAGAQIPNRTDPGSNQPNTALETDLAALRNSLKERNGLVVWFRAFTWRKYQPAESAVVEALELQPIGEFDIAAVYQPR